MKKESSIERRQFLKLSSTAVLAGFAGKIAGQPLQEEKSIIEQAAQKVGRFSRRKLGYSQREVSIMLGAGDMAPMLMEAGVLCGMNYWHKANRWMTTGAPDTILKNRDAHYCQVTVDRVGGDHFRGHLDEEEHYRYVKEAIKATGLGYFDDMQLHYGYHNADELKNDRSFVRAFDRLKKEGLVKHLCLSQHSYDGSDLVDKGQGAAEILTAVVEDGLYEHAQFIYSYGDDSEMDKFISFANTRKFGTIAMKTARGIGRMKQDESFMGKLPANTSPHHALVRWLTTATNLDAAVLRVRNIDEFVDSYSGAGKDLRAQDVKALELMVAEADRTACRLCGKCQAHCPNHIPITDILRYERYALDDYEWNRAHALYADLPTKADICVKCGTCVEHCPLNLQIPAKLSRVHAMLA